MNFFKTQPHARAANLVEVTAISQQSQTENGWQSRWDWKTFEDAERVADAASIFSGVDYIAIDNGENAFPRYDVIKAPELLDAVSYSFNGDYYPCGYIKTISKSLKKITTTTGESFYRHKQSGCWLMNRQWSMVQGHIEQQNPHF